MADAPFRFEIGPYDTGKLLPQLSRALELRTELYSRQRLPLLWRWTDWLRGRNTGRTERRLRARILALLCLALGLFLLIPGLMEPRELLTPLLVGAASTLAGLAGLWRSRKRKESSPGQGAAHGPWRGRRNNPFDQAARKLLQGKEALSAEEALSASFSQEGMVLCQGEIQLALVPYGDFTEVFETADAWLLIHGDQAVVLQRKDLRGGDAAGLRAALSARIAGYRVVDP